MKKVWLLIGFMLLLVACGGQPSSNSAAPEIDVSSLGPSVDVDVAAAVREHPDVFMLDVREQFEYDAGHIPDITLIPMSEIQARLSELPTDKEIIVTCRSGNRSGQVTEYLRQQGFTNVHNMEGGIVAWEDAGYEVTR